MSTSSVALPNRLAGRLFTDNGHLCLVLEVDSATDTARFSYREDGERCVATLPLTELTARLSQPNSLDELHSNETGSRVQHEADGWWFSTREGRLGPFPSQAQAEAELGAHLLANRRAAKAP